jgi:hypothetical protein
MNIINMINNINLNIYLTFEKGRRSTISNNIIRSFPLLNINNMKKDLKTLNESIRGVYEAQNIHMKLYIAVPVDDEILPQADSNKQHRIQSKIKILKEWGYGIEDNTNCGLGEDSACYRITKSDEAVRAYNNIKPTSPDNRFVEYEKSLIIAPIIDSKNPNNRIATFAMSFRDKHFAYLNNQFITVFIANLYSLAYASQEEYTSFEQFISSNSDSL